MAVVFHCEYRIFTVELKCFSGLYQWIILSLKPLMRKCTKYDTQSVLFFVRVVYKGWNPMCPSHWVLHMKLLICLVSLGCCFAFSITERGHGRSTKEKGVWSHGAYGTLSGKWILKVRRVPLQYIYIYMCVCVMIMGESCASNFWFGHIYTGNPFCCMNQGKWIVANGPVSVTIIMYGTNIPTKYNQTISYRANCWDGVYINMMQPFVVQTVPTLNVTKHIGALIRDGAANIAPTGNLLQAQTASVIL